MIHYYYEKKIIGNYKELFMTSISTGFWGFLDSRGRRCLSDAAALTIQSLVCECAPLVGSATSPPHSGWPGSPIQPSALTVKPAKHNYRGLTIQSLGCQCAPLVGRATFAPRHYLQKIEAAVSWPNFCPFAREKSADVRHIFSEIELQNFCAKRMSWRTSLTH